MVFVCCKSFKRTPTWRICLGIIEMIPEASPSAGNRLGGRICAVWKIMISLNLFTTQTLFVCCRDGLYWTMRTRTKISDLFAFLFFNQFFHSVRIVQKPPHAFKKFSALPPIMKRFIRIWKQPADVWIHIAQYASAEHFHGDRISPEIIFDTINNHLFVNWLFDKVPLWIGRLNNNIPFLPWHGLKIYR